jgi:enoyl-CoA hydratase/carnithine racemase
MKMNSCVRYELDGHVATITYDRPDALNTINGAMRRDLNAAFERFRSEEDAWVAIVTGAGRAFCAGADISGGAEAFEPAAPKSGDSVPRDGGGVLARCVSMSRRSRSSPRSTAPPSAWVRR